MSIRTSTLDLRLANESHFINRLQEIKTRVADLQKRAIIKIAVDGHDKIDKAAKSAIDMGKHAKDAGEKAEAAMKKAKKGAEDAEKGFKSVQDVLQDGIPQALQKLDQHLVSTAARMTGVSKNTAAMGIAAGVAIGTAVATGVGIAVVKAADLEEAMIRIKKMTGMDAVGVPKSVGDALQKDVQGMMKKHGLGLGEVSASYETAGSMGIGGDLMRKGDYAGAQAEVSEFVDINLKAATAFKMGTDETSQVLGNLANVYRTKTETINGFLKSMASTVDFVADSMVASESEIVSALARSGSAISQFTKSEKLNTDITALAGALISTGETGQYSGQIINNLLNDLYQNKDNVIGQKLMMGKNQYLKEVQADPMAILDKLFAKYDKMTPLAKTTFAKSLGMDEVSGKVFQKYMDEKFRKNLKEGREGAGGAYAAADRLDSAFNKQMEGTWKKWDRFKQILIVIAQIVGGVFLPAVNAILSVLVAVLDPLSDIVSRMIEFGAAIPGAKLIATAVSLAALAAAAAVFVTVILPALGAITGISAALVSFGGIAGLAAAAIATFSTVFMGVLTAVGAVAAGIAGLFTWPIALALALGAALLWIAHKTGVLAKFIEAFGKTKIGGDIMALINWAKGGTVKADLSAKISVFGGNAEKWLQGLWEKVDGPIYGILADLYDIYDTALGYYQKFLDVLTWLYNFIQAAMKTLKDSLGITKAESKWAMDEKADKLGLYWYDAPGAAKDYWAKKGTQTKGDAADLKKLDPFQKAYDDAPDGIFGISKLIIAIEKLTSALENFDPASFIPDSIKDKIPEPVQEVGGGIWNAFDAAVSNLIPGGDGDYDPTAVPRAIWDMVKQLADSLGITGGEDPEHEMTRGDYIASLRARHPGISVRDAALLADANGYAVGARFGSKGLFSGIVDPTEEIIPQAITERGPGPLSRLLAQIYSLPGEGSGSGSGNTYILNLGGVHASKVSSDTDIDRLAEAVMVRARDGILGLTERHGGYLRGGSLYR